MMLPEPTDVMPTRNPATRPMTAIPAKLFIVGRRWATLSSIRFCRSSRIGITINKTPIAVLIEIVDAVSIKGADVGQQSNSTNRTWNAANGQGNHDLAPHRAFLQMQESGRNLGEEVEECVGSNSHDRGHLQTEDQHREQQNAAPTPVRPIRTPTTKPTRILIAIKFMTTKLAYSPAPGTPKKPSRSRCRTISWAASSGDRSPVLMVTSASAGAS